MDWLILLRFLVLALCMFVILHRLQRVISNQRLIMRVLKKLLEAADCAEEAGKEDNESNENQKADG